MSSAPGPSDARRKLFALAASRVFDGTAMHDDTAVVINGPTIDAVLPRRGIPAGIPLRVLPGTLAPGFVDVQVNGGGGVLFNDRRTVEGIAAMARAHRRFGTTGLLPTFISDTRERMAEAIAAVRAAIAACVPGVLGIHLEGPFLNPSRAGAHTLLYIRPVDEADVALLTSLPRELGVTLVTLAPEVVPLEIIARLAAAGVVVAAGHTEASPEVIAAARGAGLTGFSHLYNAMPPLSPRAPGPVGAALADREAFASVIADLEHVSPTALNAALAARGFARTMVITDAMATVGTDLDRFDLQGRTIIRNGHRLTTGEGRLAGSDLDMASAVRNLVRRAGVPLADALRMASAVPAAFLGLSDRLGTIAPGRRADLVLFDDDLKVTATWIDGVEDAVLA